jgi:DNA polymerase III delta prime subunit
MMPFGEFKVVLLDEFDFFSVNAQAAMRGIIEEYHDTARFIFTANLPHKIIPAIHSRCQGFHIEKLDQVEFMARTATILVNENIDFDIDNLDTYVKGSYPDLRKCINMVQMNSIDGILVTPDSNDAGTSDYKLEMVDLFKNGKINDARKLLCSRAKADEMVEIYRWLYDNIDLFGSTRKQQDRAVLIIKQGLVEHAVIMDPEINLAATLIKLAINLETE